LNQRWVQVLAWKTHEVASVKKWVLIGLALVMSASVVAGIFYFTTTPGKIDRSQNKVVPVALNIMPAAQALQATLDVADMHADSLLWKRDLLERSDRGHIDLPRLIEGHYALQVFSSVTKSPKGQNYDSNGADSDTITSLAVIDATSEDVDLSAAALIVACGKIAGLCCEVGRTAPADHDAIGHRPPACRPQERGFGGRRNAVDRGLARSRGQDRKS
jgi:hypothetical protein